MLLDNSNSSPRSSDEKEVEIVIKSDGTILFVHDDDLYDLLSKVFQLDTFRASYVEPTWVGTWTVDVSPVEQILGGMTVSPRVIAIVKRREDALALERKWVQEYLKGK